VDVLEFLVRVASHIPDKGQVLQRYYGWYANRTRGIRRRIATHRQDSASAVEVEPVQPSIQEARRRWAYASAKQHTAVPSSRAIERSNAPCTATPQVDTAAERAPPANLRPVQRPLL
jgi:hypothetical protein